MKFIFHTFIIILLTILTQIGGIIYLIVIISVKKSTAKRLLIFSVLYIITTFLIVPNVAPVFGREKIKDSEFVEARSFFYKLANRNYVRPELNTVITKVAKQLNQKHNGIKLVYLDANFPFINKFPLLPHLSHNDGKKLDVTFIYKTQDNTLTNKKPSVSGYGVFVEPKQNERNQTKICKAKGKWQYDFTKYVTFGKVNSSISLSNKATKDLIKLIVAQPKVSKVFIEPHLKQRLKLNNSKIRFHGCQAVRHDDHIHLQIQ